MSLERVEIMRALHHQGFAWVSSFMCSCGVRIDLASNNECDCLVATRQTGLTGLTPASYYSCGVELAWECFCRRLCADTTGVKGHDLAKEGHCERGIALGVAI